MAALFQLSGSIKSCSHKQTSRRRNGNELPLQRPRRGCTIPTFSKSQILGAFNLRPTSYLDLAFCLGAGAAAGAGFEAGSGAGEGLTESYRLLHLQQNTTQCKKTKKEQTDVHILRAHKRTLYKEQVTYRFLIFLTKALTALTSLLIRTCHQNDGQVRSAFLYLTSISLA